MLICAKFIHNLILGVLAPPVIGIEAQDYELNETINLKEQMLIL